MGRGVALPPSLPLPSLGRQQSGCPWRCSGHGGRGPHTAPVRARLLSRGAVRWRPCVLARVCLCIVVPAGARGWGRGGGPCCGPPPGRRGLAGGRGDRPLCLGGGRGPASPWPRAVGGSVVGSAGGGLAPWFPTSPLRGGRPVALCPVPPPSLAHPSEVCALGSGCGAAPGAGCGLPPAGQPGGAGGGGVAGGPSGAGGSLSLGPSLCLARAGNKAGVIGGAQVMGGVAPHSAPVRCCVPPPGVVRVLSLCAGAGLPACRSPRGSRRRGAWGRAACGLSCVPPPGAAALSGGGGTSLRPRGKWRDGAPVARRPEGGVGVRGEGGPRRGSPPPCPGGLALGLRPSPPSSLANPPWVYMFSWGCQGVPGAWRGLVGRRWVSLAGGGGAASAPYPRGLARGAPRGGGRGGLFAAVCSPAYPGRAPRRVALSAPMLHSWVSLFCCGPRGALERWRRAAGRQRALRE